MYPIGKAKNLLWYICVLVISLGIAFITIFMSEGSNAPIRLSIVVGIPFGLFLWASLPSELTKLGNLFLQFRWYHFVWVLVFLSGLVFRVRSAEAIKDNPLDILALYRFVLMAFAGLVVTFHLFLQQSGGARSLCRGIIGFMVGYSLICLCSTFWSVYPAWTFYKSAEYLVDVMLIAVIVDTVKTTREFKILFDLTFVLILTLALAICAAAFAWPEEAIKHSIGVIGVQLRGVMPSVSSNGVGQLGALLGIVSFTRLLFSSNHKRLQIFIFIIGMFLLVLSQSRSPLSGFLLAIPFVLFSARRVGTLFFATIAILGILALTHASEVFLEFFMRGQGLGLSRPLAGRIFWWASAWEIFLERPYFGHGAYAGARFAVLANLGYSLTSSIHNTWLEVVIGSGIPGISFFLIAFVGVWITLFKNRRFIGNGTIEHRLVVEAIGILTVLSVRSMFTSELVWHPPLLFLLVLGYAEFLRRKFTNIE